MTKEDLILSISDLPSLTDIFVIKNAEIEDGRIFEAVLGYFDIEDNMFVALGEVNILESDT